MVSLWTLFKLTAMTLDYDPHFTYQGKTREQVEFSEGVVEMVLAPVKMAIAVILLVLFFLGYKISQW